MNAVGHLSSFKTCYSIRHSQLSSQVLKKWQFVFSCPLSIVYKLWSSASLDLQCLPIRRASFDAIDHHTHFDRRQCTRRLWASRVKCKYGRLQCGPLHFQCCLFLLGENGSWTRWSHWAPRGTHTWVHSSKWTSSSMWCLSPWMMLFR